MKWTLHRPQKIPPELKDLCLNPITLQLLLTRNIRTAQEIEIFFHGRYEDLLSPRGLKGVDEAVERIESARKNKEKITVFGDYDADGLTSSVLLKEVLTTLEIEPTVYIPDRNKEGYGINKNAIDFIESNYGSSLIIAVDCGISNREEIAYAREKGMGVIVIDHHSIPKNIPEDCILINPKLRGQKYPFRDLAGVGVVFKFAQALFEKFLPEKTGQLKWFLDLVAIGTVADCVSLTGENRIITKFGLVVLQKTKRTGIREIIKVARLLIDEKNPPRAEQVSFQIGPRLNASGRMDHADLTLNLLLETNPVKARVLALEVENKNSERQKLTQRIYDDIKKTLDNRNKYRLIMRKSRHWPLGVLGIVAGKISDEYRCPVFVFRENRDILEGSGRSFSDFDIVSAVGRLDRLVEKYGGHKQAMGLKLKPKNFDIFERELLDLVDREYDEAEWGKKMFIDAAIEPENIDWDLYSEIKKFEPFGEGNREPVFLTDNLVIREMKVVGNGQKHLKFAFSAGKSKILEGIFFKGASRFSQFKAGDGVSAAYLLRSNEWNGNRKLELNIIDIKKNE